ncbi:MAG: (deoxy)nucleoside triphosphate pyrophosphohydrolase [Saprospiraceae bacterium]|nr:(deoxy)nucleoside triphosphate pyrophosphohydrolase [Saprospiraceae bacterium]
MKKINVTCAIISFNDKILAVQRSESMKLPLKWEFPGGKIENGESEEECIKREIKEELNLEIELMARLSPSTHHYSDFTINLIPFTANYLSDDIKLTEHKQYVLLNKEELLDLDWAEADIPVVKEYLGI